MLCANPAQEFMANTCLLKMQSMQNTTVCPLEILQVHFNPQYAGGIKNSLRFRLQN